MYHHPLWTLLNRSIYRSKYLYALLTIFSFPFWIFSYIMLFHSWFYFHSLCKFYRGQVSLLCLCTFSSTHFMYPNVCFVNPNRYSEGNPGNCNTLNALDVCIFNHFCIWKCIVCKKYLFRYNCILMDYQSWFYSVGLSSTCGLFFLPTS